jgi:SAM-dependent methyltransferase
MYCPVTQLINFYDSEIGALAHNVLQKHIETIWPDVHGYRVMGCGYALPYMENFSKQKPERLIAMMPKGQGAQYWPQEGKNISFFCDEDSFPIENASIDRVLLVHHLEGCNDLRASIQEIWRVLKANGRLLVIVPNRLGAWVHAEWSPFGYGRPFTTNQINDLLCKNLFEQCCHKSALFVPPIPDSPIVMRSAHLIECMGGAILPFVAGVHIIEVNKRVFASIDKTGGGSAVFAKTKALLGAKNKPAPQGFNPKIKK